MRLPRRHAAAALERELTRLADGTLNARRRDRMQRRVAGSADLQARLDEQCEAVAAARAVAQRERAPIALRMEHRGRARGRSRRHAARLGLAGLAGALAWVLVAGLGAGPGALTAVQAAAIALRPPTAAVADPPDGEQTLPHVRADGLPFPYWEDGLGWRATGVRTDRLDGRMLTTVFYRRGAEQIAYTIVAGDRLPVAAHGQTILRAGMVLTSGTSGGRQVVTWVRRGHTCVLSGAGVKADALVRLAIWRGHGRIAY